MTLPEQSPIDIDAPLTRAEPHLDVVYRPGVVDRVHVGSTLRAYCDRSNFVELDGQRYELEQLHFHTPAEHPIRGRVLPMEIHLVHKVVAGEKAALAVLVDIGGRNEALERIMGGMPTREGERGAPLTFDPATLLPRHRDYYRYDGSLTTPPFSEGIRWCVFAEPITVGDTQIRRYAAAFGANARAVQPRYDRPILDCQH